MYFTDWHVQQGRSVHTVNFIFIDEIAVLTAYNINRTI